MGVKHSKNVQSSQLRQPYYPSNQDRNAYYANYQGSDPYHEISPRRLYYVPLKRGGTRYLQDVDPRRLSYHSHSGYYANIPQSGHGHPKYKRGETYYQNSRGRYPYCPSNEVSNRYYQVGHGRYYGLPSDQHIRPDYFNKRGDDSNYSKRRHDHSCIEAGKEYNPYHPNTRGGDLQRPLSIPVRRDTECQQRSSIPVRRDTECQQRSKGGFKRPQGGANDLWYSNDRSDDLGYGNSRAQGRTDSPRVRSRYTFYPESRGDGYSHDVDFYYTNSRNDNPEHLNNAVRDPYQPESRSGDNDEGLNYSNKVVDDSTNPYSRLDDSVRLTQNDEDADHQQFRTEDSFGLNNRTADPDELNNQGQDHLQHRKRDHDYQRYWGVDPDDQSSGARYSKHEVNLVDDKEYRNAHSKHSLIIQTNHDDETDLIHNGTVNTDYSNSRSQGIRRNEENEITPTILPTKRKKKHILPASCAATDAHALKAPVGVQSSVASLAKYLVKPARNDMEKVRAFYRWITENISYNTAAYFSGSHTDQTSDVVLRERTTICGGYSKLFHDLCKETGIPCKEVSGFSKGFGYDPEKPFTLISQTDHAWNIVFINDEWRPIESTWGAGHLNSEAKFEKHFEEFYFLTDPEDFIINHFPFVCKDLTASFPLQLLKETFSLEKFNTNVYPKLKGIEWGFELLSHNFQVITVDRECLITFRTRKVDLQNVTCKLLERSTKKDKKQYVLLRKRGDHFAVKVTPPAEGKYDLELYGIPTGSTDNRHDMLISLIVICQSVIKDLQPYPDKSDLWGAKPDAKLYGFTDDILKLDVISTWKGSVRIPIKTNKQVCAALTLTQEQTESDLRRFTFVSYQKNSLVIKARLPTAGYYKLTMFAKDAERKTSSLHYVADFLIDSKTPSRNTLPFPEAYSTAHDYECNLTEPTTGDLPAQQDVRLKMQSDKLARLMILKKIYKKGGDDMFDITFRTPQRGTPVCVYGSPQTDGSFDGLYVFTVV